MEELVRLLVSEPGITNRIRVSDRLLVPEVCRNGLSHSTSRRVRGGKMYLHGKDSEAWEVMFVGSGTSC